jgi:hypothetical protein
MTRNLVSSLLHYAHDLKIVVYATPELIPIIGVEGITDMHELKPEQWQRLGGGQIDPSRAKTQIYRLGVEAGMTKFLYLDVDALAMADVRPWIDAMNGSQVCTEVIAKGKKGDRINYLIWSSQDSLFEQFNIPLENTVCATQTSWLYFEKGDVCDSIQEHLDWHMAKRFPPHLLTHQWGVHGTMPDELLYTGVFGKLGIIPTAPKLDRHPIFFGNKNAKASEKDVTDKYYLLSLYGNSNLTVKRWQKLYDIKASQLGLKARSREIMQDKFANG